MTNMPAYMNKSRITFDYNFIFSKLLQLIMIALLQSVPSQLHRFIKVSIFCLKACKFSF